MLKKLICYLLLFFCFSQFSYAQIKAGEWDKLQFDNGKAKIHILNCLNELDNSVFKHDLAIEKMQSRCDNGIIHASLMRNTQNVFFGDSLYLTWYFDEKVKDKDFVKETSAFVLRITDLIGEPLATIRVDSFFHTFKVIPQWIENNSIFLITVLPINKEGEIIEEHRCEGYACVKVSKKSQENLQSSIKLLDNASLKLDIAIKEYAKARFFEEQGLYLDAIFHYYKATQLANRKYQQIITNNFNAFLNQFLEKK